MRPNIRVVMYSPFTDGDLKFPTLTEQIVNLKEKIGDSYVCLKKLGFEPDSEIIIFTAPEWYFRTHYKSNDCCSISDMEKTFKDLREFSEDYDSLLIIPGSFYYTIEENSENLVYNCTAAISEGKIISIIHKMMEADIYKGRKDIEKWGMYNGLTDKQIMNDEKCMDAILKQAKSNNNYRCRKMEKLFELDEDVINDIGLFEYRGLSFGLEICKDHNAGRLIRGTKVLVDIQILIAANVVPDKKKSITRVGGCLLYNDGAVQNNCVLICEARTNDTVTMVLLSKSIKNVKKIYYGRSDDDGFSSKTAEQYNRNPNNYVATWDNAIHPPPLTDDELWQSLLNSLYYLK